MGEEQTQGAQRSRKRFWLKVTMIVGACALSGLVLCISEVHRSNVLVHKMSEGITGCGEIRNAFHVYAASHGGEYPVLTARNASQLDVLGIGPEDLDGKYFKTRDYEVASGANWYSIKATLPGTNLTYVCEPGPYDPPYKGCGPQPVY